MHWPSSSTFAARLGRSLLAIAVVLATAIGTVRAEESGAEEETSVDPKPERHKTLFQWALEKPEASDSPADEHEVEPLATDRPDFTEASSTVGLGVLQIESGYTYTHDQDLGVKSHTHSWGETLIRYGVVDDWLELRLGVFPLSAQVTGQPSNSGVEDLYVGAKLFLTEQSGWLPEMSLTPQMLVPTGTDEFSNHQVLPGVNWLYGWDVTEWMSTAGSTQFNKAVDEDGSTFLEFAQSWTVGYTLTKKLGAYTEWFAIVPSGATTAEVEQYFNAGLTYRFTPDIQWDIRAGAADPAADDLFAGTGLSIRFRSLRDLVKS